jgi:glycine/D-amino acid oxidase-like deaminating enzyme
VPVPELHVDVLIFGGGIAGLWTLARLRNEGYSCLLLESNALGAGQTIASQGIIHGGIKYALTGQASAASKAIAEMPGIWRDCLAGRGEIDLRGVRVLSEHQYLWTAPGLLGRLGGFAASASMRAGVDRVPVESRPALLREAADVYQADEPVLDTRSILGALADSVGACCMLAHASILTCANGSGIESVRVASAGSSATHEIRPRVVVFAAGEGNQRLMSQVPFVFPLRQQLRPLHMVMARNVPGPLYAHCVAASTTPRLTITSSKLGEEWVWYIGGKVAEEGVERTPDAQVGVARDELRECLPSLDLSNTRFATLRINRAEGVREDSADRGAPSRPDTPTVSCARNVIVGWPTKLAFAPLFARQVREHVHRLGITPSGDTAPQPRIGNGVLPARYPWETSSQENDK